MKITFRFLLLVSLGALFLSACSQPFLSANPTAAASPQPLVVSATRAPTGEPALELTLEPTLSRGYAAATLTPAPVLDRVEALVTVTSLNLRGGPGTVFPILGKLAEKTQVTATGKARGTDWVQIDTGKQQGWVSAEFLDLYGTDKLAALVVKDFTGGVVVHGKVVDAAGASVSGIVFAVVKRNSTPSLRTDAKSILDGNFYAYLPSTSTGAWIVEMVAVDCKSPIVDADCKYTGSFSPSSVILNLPESPLLNFSYSK
jgi:hypothetical protein